MAAGSQPNGSMIARGQQGVRAPYLGHGRDGEWRSKDTATPGCGPFPPLSSHWFLRGEWLGKAMEGPEIETRVEHDRAQPSCNGAPSCRLHEDAGAQDAVIATTHDAPCREGHGMMFSNRVGAGGDSSRNYDTRPCRGAEYARQFCVAMGGHWWRWGCQVC